MISQSNSLVLHWLHISDLHLGNDDMSSSMMRKKLLTFVRELGHPIDYIFLTGDIKTAGPKYTGFAAEMASYLKDLCKMCDLGVNQMFIIPGNHDVNRDLPERVKAIKRMMYQRQGYYDPMSGVIEPEDLKGIWRGQQDFRDFLAQLYPDTRIKYYTDPLSPHFNIETDDFNILHLDSTISYTEGQETSDLIVGSKALYDVLERLNPKKPTILLTHYQYTSLLQDEKKAISNLLHEYGVNVWMAGHEHDHELQSIKYIHQLQAGELRYEQNATSSILIGEYDPTSFKCRVSAYKWFNEGWAKYPFVNLDAEKKDIYEFELKPKDDSILPWLTQKARKSNEAFKYRLPKNLNRNLFPVMETDGRITNIQNILTESWNTGNKGVIIIGDGGMGKSTMLLDFCFSSDVPSLYISAEQLATMRLSIEDYCMTTLFDGEKFAFENALRNRERKPDLIIVVDGLNEIDSVNERTYVQELQRLNILSGIQIVIASRVDFTIRYTLNGYTKAYINPLSDDALMSFFTKAEWGDIKQSKNLNRLLRNPMLVTIYKEICSVIDDFRDVEFIDWRIPVESATDLFYNFYLAQLALMMRRQGISGEKLLLAIICINQILPALAHIYETSFSINKTNEDFRSIINSIISQLIINENNLLAAREHYREYNDVIISYGSVVDMMINELHLLHRTRDMTSFVHQMYRDYLSAKYISDKSSQKANIQSLWNNRPLPMPIATHICNYCKDYWQGLALEIKESAEHREDVDTMIKNLIVTFPPMIGVGAADFSKLDLRSVKLPNLPEGIDKIPLKESIINNETLGIYYKNPHPYKIVGVSKDSQFIAAVAGTVLEIFNIRTATEIFHHNIGKKASQLLFAGHYLFINAGNLIVFINDGGWRYVGEIKGESGGIFNSKTREIIVSEDKIVLYYKSRKLVYSLRDCSLINRWQGNYGIEYPDGYSSLMYLRNAVDLRSNDGEEEQILASYKNDSVEAISYSDGRIEIYQGGELLRVLGKQFSVLQDAAVSGNGSLAVTLSRKSFKGFRRVQIWDLNKKRKTGETFCPEIIRRINLSEDGTWIIGVTEKESWFYNLHTGKDEWRTDSFISNQHGKLVTFGESILRRNSFGKIEMFNIGSGDICEIDSPVFNPRVVSFLNNGTLAAVDSTGTTLRFNSERNGEEVLISNPGERFIALQTFKAQPFIAVVADTGMISIYHTGTGQRTRKLDRNFNVKTIACHQDKTLLAHIDGDKRLSIEAYEEWISNGQRRGHWHHYDCRAKINYRILDMAFNAANHSLIVIMGNGEIAYFKEDNCTFKYSCHIITAFNTASYDFTSVNCSEELSEILRQNGCEI